ncbi:MAG: hypothetical protein CMJ78_23675 [Planctomycetaceae bacterium]|nr:hypothetical protein [Planctomycetaceae bacterium]
MRALLVLCLVLFHVQSVLAHYVWVTVDDKEGDKGTANIYFEGSASPGKGEHLDPFVKRGKIWIRTPDGEAKNLKAIDFKRKVKDREQRWLKATLPDSGPRSVDMYGKWGVYAYGKTNVLLHYYGRAIQFGTNDELAKLSRAKHMNFEIAPTVVDGTLQVQVLFKGEPKAKASVRIRGPKGFNKTLTTSEDGIVTLPKDATAKGKYSFYSKTEFKTEGKDDGKDYSIIRHHATLLLTIP